MCLQEWSEGSYIASYVKRYDKYFRRKGWFGLSEGMDDELSSKISQENPKSKDNTHMTLNEEKLDGRLENIHGGSQAWGFTSNGTRIVVEVATAYAITKALMPLRLMLSLWLTPWFARVSVTRIAGSLGALRKQIGRNTGPKKP